MGLRNDHWVHDMKSIAYLLSQELYSRRKEKIMADGALKCVIGQNFAEARVD